MAVCNIFSPLNNPTGNFLMFSNYADDMNKYRAQGNKYKVIPSKFYVLDVDFQDVIPSMSGRDYNLDIPHLFQNRYENWVAYSKNNPSQTIDAYKARLKTNTMKDETDMQLIENISEDEFYKRMFWAFLMDCKFLKKISNYGSSTDLSVSNVKYQGNISLESYDKRGSEGYSEIVCHIPSETSVKNYIMFNYNDHFTTTINKGYIEGYDETNADRLLIPGNLNTTDKTIKVLSHEIPFGASNEGSTDAENTTSYKFNTVVVLYDVVCVDSGTTTTIEEGIPMGVYFTGTFEQDSSTMLNEHTIYIQNKDIFGASTTYSLRICTRYTVNPNYFGIEPGVEVCEDDKSNMSILLSKMADNIDAMNDVLKAAHTNNAINKDLYNIFKSGQVNVPYIKEIDGVYYWFVNGKLVSQLSFEEITPDQIGEEYDMMRYVYDKNYRDYVDRQMSSET